MNKSQRGSGHPLVILAIIVAVIGVAGAGYFVFNKNKDKASDSVASGLTKAEVSQLKEECKKEYNDDDLCKFLSTWADMKDYQSTITTNDENGASVMTMVLNDDKSQLIIATNATESFNVISIGKTTYTKDPSDGKWWKQVSPDTEVESTVDDYKFDTANDKSTESGDTTTYASKGKEACGDRSCFKYQVVDSVEKDTIQFVWFDDKDYLLRRWSYEYKDGNKSDSVYTYDSVKVDEPSPIKEVPAGQVVMPGGSLISVPQASDYTLPEDQPVDAPADDVVSEE